MILATDNDAPGEALAEELARRLGKERCWRVRWPQKRDRPRASSSSSSSGDKVDVEVLASEDGGLNSALPSLTFQADIKDVGTPDAIDMDTDDGFRKDANDVLVKDGEDELRRLIDNAEPTPINGLYRFQ